MSKKKTFLTLLLIALAILWIWFVGDRQTSAPLERAEPATYAALDASSGRLLVDLGDSLSRAEVRALEKKYGLKLRENSGFSFARRLFGAAVKGRQDLAGLIARLRKDPAVEYAELDAVYSIPPLEAGLTISDSADKPGANAALRAEREGRSVAHDWRRSGADIAGATAKDLDITGARAAHRGVYTCVATTPHGIASSHGATLTLLAPPVIVLHPADHIRIM